MKPLGPSNKASQSYSIVAVTLLILAAASVSIIYAASQREMDRVSRSRDLILMDEMVNENHQVIIGTAVNLANYLIYKHTQIDRDVTSLTNAFDASMTDHINSSYPVERGRFIIDVADHNVTINHKTQKMWDIGPATPTKNSIGKTIAPKAWLGGIPREVCGSVCWQLAGYINYSVADPATGTQLNKSLRVDRTIFEKTPFLMDKLDTFRADTGVDSGTMGRIIKYILTTIAQYRALQGYGWEDKRLGEALDILGFECDIGSASDKGTHDILTPDDVELAFNTALILNMMKLYRTYDPGALNELERHYPGIEDLIQKYKDRSTIDPADIILLYEGYASSDNRTEINLQLIVLQALYGIMENLIYSTLKTFGGYEILDHFFDGFVKFIKIIDAAWSAINDTLLGKSIEAIADTFKDIIDKVPGPLDGSLSAGLKKLKSVFTGGDDASEPKGKYRKFARDYVASLLEQTGVGTKLLDIPDEKRPRFYVDISNQTFSEDIFVSGAPEYAYHESNYTKDENLTYLFQISSNYSGHLKTGLIKPELLEQLQDKGLPLTSSAVVDNTTRLGWTINGSGVSYQVVERSEHLSIYNATNWQRVKVISNQSYIKGYNSRVYKVNVKFLPANRTLDFPVIEDLTETDPHNNMWYSYFNEYLRPPGIGKTVSGLVFTNLHLVLLFKNLGIYLAENFTDDSGIIASTIEKYRFIDEVDPSDQTSFLEMVYRNVDATADTINDYYTNRSQPGSREIERIIEDVFGEFTTFNEMLEGIGELVRGNFSALAGETGIYSYDYTRDPRSQAGKRLVEELLGDEANIGFAVDRDYEDVWVQNKVWISEFEDRPPVIISTNLGSFDLECKNDPDEDELTSAALEKLGKTSATDGSGYPGDYATDVFRALKDYTYKGYEMIVDMELNNSGSHAGGITDRINWSLFTPDDPVAFELRQGIANIGYSIEQVLIHPTKGLIPIFTGYFKNICFDILEGDDFSNTKYITPLVMDKDFEFYHGDRQTARANNNLDTDKITLAQEPKFFRREQVRMNGSWGETEYREYLGSTKTGGNKLLIDFFHPNESLPMDDPNRTEGFILKNINDTQGYYYNHPKAHATTGIVAPYGAIWQLRLMTRVDLDVRLRDLGLLVNGTAPLTWLNSSVFINMSLSIQVTTGWALKGVDYEMDLNSSEWVAMFLTETFKSLKGSTGSSLDSLMKFIEILSNFVTRIMGYASEVIEWLNDQVQLLIAEVQKLLGMELEDLLMWAIGTLGLKEFSFKIYGVDVCVNINTDYFGQKDEEPDASHPLLSIELKMDDDLDLTLAVASAPGTKYGMGVTLVGSFYIAGMDFDIIVDPLMAFYNHIFVLYGRRLNETGEGWGLELMLPECVSYKKLEYTLPVSPPGINIPQLGICIFPTLGVNLKYSFPSKDDLVVNEFDYNKMEVYNPTAEEKDLDGFTVENRNEPKRSFTIEDENLAVGPGEYAVITYDDHYEREENGSLWNLSKQAFKDKDISAVSTHIIDKLDGVDNSFLGTGKGRISAGEGLKLVDPGGEVVDTTPIRRPPKEKKGETSSTRHLNTSWQRKYDAGYEWGRETPNFGSRNNKDPPQLDIKGLILTALMDSFTEAYVEHQIQQKIKTDNITLDDVTACLKAAINKFIEKILELIRKVIIEVEFFLDLGIGPIGAANPVGGMRLSFVIDGEGIAILLEWLVKCIGVLVQKMLYGDAGGGYPPLPGNLPEHLYIRLVNYFGLDALPDSIKNKLPESVDPSGLNMNIFIQMNLPVLGCLLGRDWGRWQVDFGIYLDGRTGPIVEALYSEAPDNDPDFWFMKGRIFQIRND